MSDPYWNHNVHYQPLILDLIPDGCKRALDVGCGDGLLVRKLAARIPVVTGADRSAEMIGLAQAESRHLHNVTFVEADYLDDAHGLLSEGRYDLVIAVSVVHHADFGRALEGLARLLTPGGRMIVVGLGKNRSAVDWIAGGVAQVVSRIVRRPHGGKRGPHGMPAMDPIMSWGQTAREARAILTGCRWRRLLLRRYLLVWDKPWHLPSERSLRQEGSRR
ncbi:class I SAM-dependent methyltransferase [Rhizohabitans arisaemae]|uniref:class I SAM-dependent methyltransferase n=1 Tax=Rhizohabitans arisaemae TaxID=2720610 RepID=UPI0024B16A72|nr:class I SAM-dependent methyltransferase [Rhizohabitans arisaemae]